MAGSVSSAKSIFNLKDGRSLGYHFYGDNNGFPVLAFHGTPGSRLWFKDDDPISQDLGVKLITIDRPGYGLSDRFNNNTIRHTAEDIKELIDYFGLETYSILGVSGGGPFALGLACTSDNRLYKCGLIASMSELINRKPPKGMCRPNRMAIHLSRYFPWLVKYNYRQQKHMIENDPELYKKEMTRFVNHLSPSDREIIKRPEFQESNIIQMREAFRNNHGEAVDELRMLCGAWNLSWGNIKSPVEVWHGEDDTLSPIEGIKQMISKIPIKNVHFLPDKGHFLDEDEDIWRSILISIIN